MTFSGGKKIIALAVAAVASSAAFAQSNVTVYGVVDMYAANVGAGNQGLTASVLQSGGLSGSRLGFKGTEDLGGGTSALFTVEFGSLNIDGAKQTVGGEADNGMTGTRQSFVGLSGAYGTVIAGRLQTLAYNHNAAFNPTFGTGLDTQASVVSGVNSTTAGVTGYTYAATSNLAIAGAERLDNAIAYVAPKIGDVTVAVAHTTGAAASDVAGFSATEVSASYANGPLSIGTCCIL